MGYEFQYVKSPGPEMPVGFGVEPPRMGTVPLVLWQFSDVRMSCLHDLGCLHAHHCC